MDIGPVACHGHVAKTGQKQDPTSGLSDSKTTFKHAAAESPAPGYHTDARGQKPCGKDSRHVGKGLKGVEILGHLRTDFKKMLTEKSHDALAKTPRSLLTDQPGERKGACGRPSQQETLQFSKQVPVPVGPSEMRILGPGAPGWPASPVNAPQGNRFSAVWAPFL